MSGDATGGDAIREGGHRGCEKDVGVPCFYGSGFVTM